jgi:MFS family permease
VLSLPAALLVARVGPKPVTLGALTVLGLASLGFGLADSAPLLILARLIQGIGACALWSAVLAWTVAVAPAGQRATMLGTVVGAAIFGAVGGPVLGALGDLVGTRPVFAVFVALPAVLIVLVARRDAPPRISAAGSLPAALGIAAAEPRMRTGVWLMVVPALSFGVINLLVPLRLDDFGLGAAAIGAVFLVAAALESTMSPIAGRVADRRGELTPARLGLALGGVALLVLALPIGAAPMVVLVVVATTVLGMLWTPAMALLAAGSEAQGVDPAYGFGLANLAWGLGTTLGGGAGGALAEATTDAVPFVVLAAVAVSTTLALGQRSAAGQAIR